jgi:uracil-DNA glycosylase
MGNIPLYALTGRDSGITALSGQKEWVGRVGAWVIWCVHPAAVLRSRGSNIDPFRNGIETFAEIFNKEIGQRAGAGIDIMETGQ